VFALIETHSAADAALTASIHQDHENDVVRIDAEQSALDDLIEAAPTTLAGVIATRRQRGAPAAAAASAMMT
jgi:hypothetical protein